VEAVEELQRRGSLQRLSVTPLMAGAGWASEYGAALRRRLEAAVPQVRTLFGLQYKLAASLLEGLACMCAAARGAANRG